MEKRKLSSDSGVTPEAKNARNGGSPSDDLIGSIREASSVLLDSSIQELCGHKELQDSTFIDSDVVDVANKSTKVYTTHNIHNTTSSTDVLLNREILHFMKKIDSRLDNVEKKLTKLDLLEEKVTNIDTDVKKLWVYVHDNIKTSDEKVSRCMDQIDELQFALGQANDCITKLSQEQLKYNEDMDYLQSQSMRNNLIIGNIPESINEKHTVTEMKVRAFMVDELGIQQGVVDQINIERAHRSIHPPQGSSKADFTYNVESDDDKPRTYGPPRKPRNVFVKFASFKDRELVRNSRGKLRGSCFYVTEQYPKAVNDRRKALIPRLREAKANGRDAWLSYDKLYIDGVQQSLQSTNNIKSCDNVASNDSNAGSDIAASSRGAHQRRGGGRPGGRGRNASRARGGRGVSHGSGGRERNNSSL
jgi:hypothetical protein